MSEQDPKEELEQKIEALEGQQGALPKVLHCGWVREYPAFHRDSVIVLRACEDPAEFGLRVGGEEKVLGVYQLVKVVKVGATPTFEEIEQ